MKMRLVLGYPVEQRHLQHICDAAPDWEVIDAAKIASERNCCPQTFYVGMQKYRSTGKRWYNRGGFAGSSLLLPDWTIAYTRRWSKAPSS